MYKCPVCGNTKEFLVCLNAIGIVDAYGNIAVSNIETWMPEEPAVVCRSCKTCSLNLNTWWTTAEILEESANDPA